jgi:hypothetical protein
MLNAAREARDTMKKKAGCAVAIALCSALLCVAQEREPKNLIGTSPFVLLSLLPDSGTVYGEFEYGRKIDDRQVLLVGVDVFQYAAPLSRPYAETENYPGHVLSGGLIAADQVFLWRGLFVAPIVNPCIIAYYDQGGRYIQSGFMLLLCARAGYHFDFRLFGRPLYFELGGEIDWWPVNLNEPRGFGEEEGKYGDHSFSPALNIGLKF